MNIKELLEKDFVLLDGAMGTVLQNRGLKAGEIPELLNITNPELLIDIHKSYIDSGAEVLYANTFSANSYKLKDCGYSVSEVIKAGVANARKAAEGTKVLVAASFGPIGQLLEPTGTATFEEAYEHYKEQVIAASDADLLVFETMTDLYELKAAVLAAKENTELPIFCTMTFEENRRTFTGCCISSMVLTLEGLGVDAIGMNCSLGPKEAMPIVDEITKWATIPVVVRANAGLPDPITNKYDITPEEYANYVGEMTKLGVRIFGGCCGTSPEYIKAIKNKLSTLKPVIRKAEPRSAICSAIITVEVNQPRIIGERINPTGKKLFKEALKRNDIDYILNQAIEQTKAGADLLDVNVGLPDINEKDMMVRTVKALQGVVDVPLQIDTTESDVLEAALRVYNGKPIVNSVNGEEESLQRVLPLVKKYGAAVVGLTLDKRGIPQKAEERFAIAEKILDRALALGIRREDVYIDCLTLTASAEQAAVMETLKAVRMVKERLGLKTVLGVSNISFGLPNRELLNSNFLTMAMTNGLDLPIINPNIASMTGAVRAFRLLANYDKNGTDFIAEYNTATVGEAPKQAVKADDIDIFYAIENGLKKDAARITTKLLETTEPMAVVNEMLIPALDKAGSRFETGKIFLPQLILSAGVAQVCFDVIKNKLIETNSAPVSKGKIILATVKGDIHDIGKNIVKVLLENYGYEVIDLGKDVDYQLVVDTAIEQNIKLVGLSALMTTTLKSMENTIKLLRENNVDCKIMVGGAVLTPDYAKKIGADFYSKDAKESVDIAKRILG